MSGAGTNGQQHPVDSELVSLGGTNANAAKSNGEREPTSNPFEDEDLLSTDPLGDGLNEPCVCLQLQISVS